MIVWLQILLASGAVIWSIGMNRPWPAVAALVLLAAETASITRRRRDSRWGWALAWGCTLIVSGSLLLTQGGVALAEPSTTVLAWLCASALGLASQRLNDPGAKTRWRTLAMAWAFGGGGVWLAHAYSENQSAAFHLGLAANLALLILCRVWFRLRAFAIQAVNTLILLALALPLFDLCIRPRYRLAAHPEPARRPYAYENAKRDPGGFASWQAYWARQWTLLEPAVMVRANAGKAMPFRLRPNSQGLLCQSRIAINSRGFRGKEIPPEKGRAYRIVALGESTTFGLTLEANDRPWPEWLEQMIQERLKPPRPVEVINAGTPACSLEGNLQRLPGDILPLKPDLILSYHGHNGFYLIHEALPLSFATDPPAYRERPLKILADAEYRLRILWFKQRQTARLDRNPPSFAHPLETKYAEAYRQLIHFASTNNIRLAIANYSLAVNRQSAPELIEFYRPLMPTVYWQIQANTVHSAIVRALAEQHPAVCFVDTHPQLDGAHGKFIDVMHFTQEGERQLAEHFFAAITNVLAADWAPAEQAGAK